MTATAPAGSSSARLALLSVAQIASSIAALVCAVRALRARSMAGGLAWTYVAYTASVCLACLAAFPVIDRWQNLSVLAMRIRADTASDTLAVLNADETTIAMLDDRLATRFIVLQADTLTPTQAVSSWFNAHGSRARVLVLLPGHAAGELTPLIERLTHAPRPDDGVVGRPAMQGVARIVAAVRAAAWPPLCAARPACLRTPSAQALFAASGSMGRASASARRPPVPLQRRAAHSPHADSHRRAASRWLLARNGRLGAHEFRPARLATYSAVSARRNIVLGVSRPGSETVTPMLAVIMRRSGGQCVVSIDMIPSRKPSASSCASGRGVWGSTIKNSSPPSRPKNAGSCTAPRTVSAMILSTSSPAGCP